MIRTVVSADEVNELKKRRFVSGCRVITDFRIAMSEILVRPPAVKDAKRFPGILYQAFYVKCYHNQHPVEIVTSKSASLLK